MQPFLDEYLNQYPDTELFLRGVSGFATPELYTQAESNGCSYAIRFSLQICMLAYNLFNWFRRLCLPGKMKKFRADTIRLKLLKIAGNLVKSARSITFKLCSSSPYIREFYETFKNIDRLRPKLE